MNATSSREPRRGLRWWPAVLLLLLHAGAIVWVRAQTDWPFQKRNLTSYEIVIVGVILLLVWWTFLSRAPKRLRLGITFGCVGLAVVCAGLFRISGMSGDLRPIVEFRWAGHKAQESAPAVATTNTVAWLPHFAAPTNAFPQFYGPNRDGVLPGPVLNTNWTAHPPQEIWRRPVGAGWSGFAIMGEVCVTQEQDGPDECVVARALATGHELWRHRYVARYNTTIAGEGPRATPTIVSNRVYTFGATGILNCLDLTTGQRIWSCDVVQDSGGEIPQWGATSSPLMVDDLVIVHGGEGGSHSLFAYQAQDGQSVWRGGMSPSYSTPILATLAGVSQVLALNDGSASGHNPRTGVTLWERSWGNGNVACATPLVVSSNRVLFSSGYGVGAELLEISQRVDDKLAVKRVWKSIRMKAKFSHLFIRDDCLFGLDDGILACVDLADGSQKWKEGRYGHGQGLLVGDLYLLMAESGDLVLLRPTPAAPNEFARQNVFNSKTWNPPALAGDLLLLRNDREAVCLRLPRAN
jgi:outer membrane protein assembly factor BamB